MSIQRSRERGPRWMQSSRGRPAFARTRLFLRLVKSKGSLTRLDLSVHAGLGQPVVHDAQGSHTSGEAVLVGAGAGLARVPDGHLRELLLHYSQVHLMEKNTQKRKGWVFRGRKIIRLEKPARIDGNKLWLARLSLTDLIKKGCQMRFFLLFPCQNVTKCHENPTTTTI